MPGEWRIMSVVTHPHKRASLVCSKLFVSIWSQRFDVYEPRVQVSMLEGQLQAKVQAEDRLRQQLCGTEAKAVAAQVANDELQNTVKRLRKALAAAEQKYANHPAIGLANTEREGRLAAKAEAHHALRRLVPHQQAALQHSEWRDRVTAQARAATARAEAREREAARAAAQHVTQQSAAADTRRRCEAHKHESAVLRLQV